MDRRDFLKKTPIAAGAAAILNQSEANAAPVPLDNSVMNSDAIEKLKQKAASDTTKLPQDSEVFVRGPWVKAPSNHGWNPITDGDVIKSVARLNNTYKLNIDLTKATFNQKDCEKVETFEAGINGNFSYSVWKGQITLNDGSRLKVEYHWPSNGNQTKREIIHFIPNGREGAKDREEIIEIVDRAQLRNLPGAPWQGRMQKIVVKKDGKSAMISDHFETEPNSDKFSEPTEKPRYVSAREALNLGKVKE